MTRIILDPEEVNQTARVTLTDGTVVALDEADAAMLGRIAEQLHIHRSTYAHALVDPAIGDRVAAGELDVAEHAPLHQAVQERLREARAGRRRRAATDLSPGVLLQTRTWTSSRGATRLLVDLTPSHRRNLMGWLERNSDVLHQRAAADWTNEQLESIEPRTPWVAGTPLYRRLEALVAAETGHELARDRAREIARRLEFERSGHWPES